MPLKETSHDTNNSAHFDDNDRDKEVEQVTQDGELPNSGDAGAVEKHASSVVKRLKSLPKKQYYYLVSGMTGRVHLFSSDDPSSSIGCTFTAFDVADHSGSCPNELSTSKDILEDARSFLQEWQCLSARVRIS